MANSVFFRIYQHLLPRARAWSITKKKQLREFFEGLVPFQEDYKLFIDEIYEDIDPEKTRELEKWEDQFQLSQSGTDTERRQSLDAAWKAHGGQSPGYLQGILRQAGFDVYVHEWWYYMGSTRVTRNPTLYVGDGAFTVVLGENDAVLGETAAVVGERSAGGGKLLVNKGLGVSYFKPTPATCLGEPDAVLGEPDAVLGETNGLRIVPKTYEVPNNPTKWPYFFYIGGETFPDFADVSIVRQIEFERMILKYFPAHLWGILLINYV